MFTKAAQMKRESLVRISTTEDLVTMRKNYINEQVKCTRDRDDFGIRYCKEWVETINRELRKRINAGQIRVA